MNESIFEVFIPSKNKTYRIWENGEIEGFEPDAIIFNKVVPRIVSLECKLLERNSQLIDANNEIMALRAKNSPHS